MTTLFVTFDWILLAAERPTSESGDNVSYVKSRRLHWEPLSVSHCTSSCEGKISHTVHIEFNLLLPATAVQ